MGAIVAPIHINPENKVRGMGNSSSPRQTPQLRMPGVGLLGFPLCG